MSNGKKMWCNFCGKELAEVLQLIAGPGVNICNECVVLAWNIIDPIQRGEAEYASWALSTTSEESK